MKAKCLLYCTLAKPMLENHKRSDNKYHCLSNLYDLKWCKENNYKVLNGTIALECEVECERFEFDTMSREIFSYWYENGHEVDYKKMCLTYDEVWNYLGDNVGYALHIHNLKLLDKPLKLSELLTYNTKNVFKVSRVEKAPQNMQWVWYKGEKYCLISIRSPWYCLLANGDKTIEVRKKILKGMI